MRQWPEYTKQLVSWISCCLTVFQCWLAFFSFILFLMSTWRTTTKKFYFFYIQCFLSRMSGQEDKSWQCFASVLLYLDQCVFQLPKKVNTQYISSKINRNKVRLIYFSNWVINFGPDIFPYSELGPRLVCRKEAIFDYVFWLSC